MRGGVAGVVVVVVGVVVAEGVAVIVGVVGVRVRAGVVVVVDLDVDSAVPGLSVERGRRRGKEMLFLFSFFSLLWLRR